MNPKCSETYYAVRMGRPGRHYIYFKLREGTNAPELFNCLKDARVCAAEVPQHGTAVKVKLREVK